MTTNSRTAEDRLAKLGIQLPDAPTPFGAYVPAVQTGNLLFLSGMLATSGHTAAVVGVVGKDLNVEAGRKAACTAALNVLALTKRPPGLPPQIFLRATTPVAGYISRLTASLTFPPTYGTTNTSAAG